MYWHLLKDKPWVTLLTSVALISCNLLPSKAPSRISGGSQAGENKDTTTDTQAIRVDALAVNFYDNLVAQGLSEGQVAVIANGARTEMSAVYTNSIVVGQATSMALQQEDPDISELMGAMSRGATKSIAEESVQASDKEGKTTVAKAIIKAALSTIKSNAESSASEDKMTSSLEEIVAEMTKSLSLAGVADDDLQDVTGAVSGEAIANVSLAGFAASSIEAKLPKIVESTARGIANARMSAELVPTVLGEATKVMMTRLKDLNISGSNVTQVAGKFSDAAIAGVLRSSRGPDVLPNVAGYVTSGTISSLADHGFSKEEIRQASSQITKNVVKAAAVRTTDAIKVANIQDVTITRAAAGLQNTGFSESEVDLIKQDLSSNAVQAAVIATSTPLTNQVVFKKSPQISWLAIKDGQSSTSWSRVDLTDTAKCDAYSCKIPITAADKSYAMAYACENPINIGVRPPFINDPLFFQRNNFDPMWPTKRVNVSVIYDKIIGTVSGQSPNCNDLYTPNSDPGATAPIYLGPSRPVLVPVTITVTDENPVCQIGRTPFSCGSASTINLPLGKGVKILIGSGLGSADLIAPSGIGFLEVPKKVKLVRLDVEQGKTYNLTMDRALAPSTVALEIQKLTADRAVNLANTASVSTDGSSFSVSLDLTNQRFIPDTATATKSIYNLPAAANLWGAVITLTGSTSTQVAFNSGQSSSSAWKSQAFTKKILPSDSSTPLSVSMLPDVDAAKVALTNGTDTALPLNWASSLTATDSPVRRLNLNQMTPDSFLVYTIYAPPTGVAADATLSVPSALKSLPGWSPTWNISKVLNSFWTSSVSTPIGTDGISYSMSSDRLGPVNTTTPETRTTSCMGAAPSGSYLTKGATTVSQTLTDNGWAPASYWRYTSAASPNGCEFTCDPGYRWNLSACVQSAETVSVLIAESFPSMSTNNFNSQLVPMSSKACAIVATFASPASYFCEENGAWRVQTSFTDPRPSVPTSSTATSGIPVYLQEVGSSLSSIYTDANGLMFAKMDTNNRWVRSTSLLPGTATGATLQFAKILGTGNSLYAVYAWQPANVPYWKGMIAKSTDSGITWYSLNSAISMLPFSAHVTWDNATTPTTVYLKYTDTATTPVTKIMNISGLIAGPIIVEGTATEPSYPIVYWNGQLLTLTSTGQLASVTLSSGSWTIPTLYTNIMAPNPGKSLLVADGSVLDAFYYEPSSRVWKHSRVTTSPSGLLSPDNEIVAFSQNYYSSPDKRSFISTISSTKYFNFYDGIWRRVSFSSGSAKAASQTISMVNPALTGAIKAAGLLVDGLSLRRITSTTANFELSQWVTGASPAWSTPKSWNTDTTLYKPSAAFGKVAKLSNGAIAYLDCKQGDPSYEYLTVVDTTTDTLTSKTVLTTERCPKERIRNGLVSNPSATTGKPNLFSLWVDVSPNSTTLSARRFTYTTSDKDISTTSTKFNIGSLTSPHSIKQAVYATDKIHILMCDDGGNIQILTWVNPNLSSLDLPSNILFRPSSNTACSGSSIVRDASGNISLKLLDEQIASFSIASGIWSHTTSTPTSLTSFRNLGGGNIFMFDSSTYCKVTGLGGSNGAGSESLVLLCMAKPTTAVPNPIITQKMIDDSDFGGGLNDHSVAVFDGKIHVVYPSLYKPDTFRTATVSP